MKKHRKLKFEKITISKLDASLATKLIGGAEISGIDGECDPTDHKIDPRCLIDKPIEGFGD